MTVRTLSQVVILVAVVSLLPAHALAAKTLILGVFPRHNARKTVHDFQPLQAYLSQMLKRPVKLETSANFKSFWKAVTHARYDIVHYNQYHYLRSHTHPGYDVIAMNQEFGHDTIAGGIVVVDNSHYRRLGQLRNRKIVFGGGPKAMMSYIVPQYLLQEAGLHKKDYHAAFARNPPNALMAVCLGEAVAAGVGDRIVEEFTANSKCGQKRRLRFLARSRQMAQLPWAVKASLSASLRNRIKVLLINLHNSRRGRNIIQKMGVTNIVPAADSDYDQYREIIKSLNKLGS